MSDVYTLAKMESALSLSAFKAMKETGTLLAPDDANDVAMAMIARQSDTKWS